MIISKEIKGKIECNKRIRKKNVKASKGPISCLMLSSVCLGGGVCEIDEKRGDDASTGEPLRPKLKHGWTAE